MPDLMEFEQRLLSELEELTEENVFALLNTIPVGVWEGCTKRFAIFRCARLPTACHALTVPRGGVYGIDTVTTRNQMTGGRNRTSSHK